ncbi:DUF3427 domain-containing protein [Photobacterium angustum]|nr:DUF3427 domain-containing protein [Photobacterium angustum]
MAKADENFNFSNLVVGDEYSRMSSMGAGEVTLPKQSRDISGITRFKNCVVLFVTLDKKAKEDAHKYQDLFLLNGKEFHWESQNLNTPETEHMKMIIDGEPVILFARIHEKVRGKTQPFIYIGQLQYKNHYWSGVKKVPVEVLYDVKEYQNSPNAQLSAIYLWEKSGNDDDQLLPPLVKKVRKSAKGRMVDAKKKKAIELHAMNVAKEHYESLGYEVIDTSANSPYDFECFLGEEFRRVEVKGTTTKGDIVNVTANEVTDALSDVCETDLFIVFDIEVILVAKEQYQTEGTEFVKVENWKPLPKNLEPTMYRYHR